MGFTETNLELTAQNLEPDPLQRKLYKNIMNSVIGKFSQRQSYPNTKYVSRAEEIDQIICDGHEEIVDFRTIGSDICELTTSPLNQKRKTANRKTNPIITAFVTSLSRIDMHQNMDLLRQNQFYVLYTDTDSIIFFGKKKRHLPFEINGGLGYFKHEYKEPLNGFCCIGKKSYAVSSKTSTTHAKVCGLCFDSKQAERAISFKDFENFLCKNIPIAPVPQSRTEQTATPFSIRKVVRNIHLPVSLNYNRVLKRRNDFLYTEPYGYSE